MYSVKALPSAALSKAYMAKKSVGKGRFAECFLSGIAECLTLGKSRYFLRKIRALRGRWDLNP
jgi:hypothetical protein